MVLLGRVWNSLSEDDRATLLTHCYSIHSDSIKEHEKTLKWDALMPVTQRDLLNIDCETILGRYLRP